MTIDDCAAAVSNEDMSAARELADAVRKYRAKEELTQVEFAAKADISPASVYRLEAEEVSLDGPVVEKVRALLGLPSGHSGGHSASGVTSTRHESKANLPSNMGQMVGRLQLPASVSDFYSELLKVAIKRDDPPEVFKALAAARDKAPPEADLGWWLDLYLDAKTQASSPK